MRRLAGQSVDSSPPSGWPIGSIPDQALFREPVTDIGGDVVSAAETECDTDGESNTGGQPPRRGLCKRIEDLNIDTHRTQSDDGYNEVEEDAQPIGEHVGVASLRDRLRVCGDIGNEVRENEADNDDEHAGDERRKVRHGGCDPLRQEFDVERVRRREYRQRVHEVPRGATETP